MTYLFNQLYEYFFGKSLLMVTGEGNGGKSLFSELSREEPFIIIANDKVPTLFTDVISGMGNEKELIYNHRKEEIIYNDKKKDKINYNRKNVNTNYRKVSIQRKNKTLNQPQKITSRQRYVACKKN